MFALWRRPWRLVSRLGDGQRQVLLALGVVLAAMNSLFYLAVDRLLLSTVGAIEFLFANCAGFVLYVVLGHRIANTTPDDEAGRDRAGLALSGIDQLGAAMSPTSWPWPGCPGPPSR